MRFGSPCAALLVVDFTPSRRRCRSEPRTLASASYPCKVAAPRGSRVPSTGGTTTHGKRGGETDERHNRVLCGLKLRAPGRQFDGEDSRRHEARRRELEVDSIARGLLRSLDRRRPNLLETRNGSVSRRKD